MIKQNKDNISLKEYFDGRFTELKSYMELKFNNIEKSTCLAQDNLNTRLESMNEFRNSMKDQASQFITRMEHEALISKYDTSISLLMTANAKQEGKASQKSVSIAYIIAGVSLFLTIIGLIIRF